MSGTHQTTIEGEPNHEIDRGRGDNVPRELCGAAAVLWEVGADPDVDDEDELREVYERCTRRGLLDGVEI